MAQSASCGGEHVRQPLRCHRPRRRRDGQRCLLRPRRARRESARAGAIRHPARPRLLTRRNAHHPPRLCRRRLLRSPAAARLRTLAPTRARLRRATAAHHRRPGYRRAGFRGGPGLTRRLPRARPAARNPDRDGDDGPLPRAADTAAFRRQLPGRRRFPALGALHRRPCRARTGAGERKSARANPC